MTNNKRYNFSPISYHSMICSMANRLLSPLAVLALLCTLCLTACSNTATQQEYFLLSNSKQAAIHEISGQPQVSIRRVKLPSYLNLLGISRQLPDGRISVSASLLWAEKLSQAIPNVLAEEIAVQIHAPVEVHPLPPGVDVDTIVEVDISRFIGNNKTLDLQGSYRLIARKKLQKYPFSIEVALANDSTTELVDAYHRALHDLAIDIAKQL